MELLFLIGYFFNLIWLAVEKMIEVVGFLIGCIFTIWYKTIKRAE